MVVCRLVVLQELLTRQVEMTYVEERSFESKMMQDVFVTIKSIFGLGRRGGA